MNIVHVSPLCHGFIYPLYAVTVALNVITEAKKYRHFYICNIWSICLTTAYGTNKYVLQSRVVKTNNVLLV